MRFKSKPIKGKGRGKKIGVPTINLKIPEDFSLEEGIYAAVVLMNNKSYAAAMHYGPVPVFNDPEKSLEVFLLDIKDPNLEISEEIEVDTKDKIREIQNFKTPEEMVKRIEEDIKQIRRILNF